MIIHDIERRTKECVFCDGYGGTWDPCSTCLGDEMIVKPPVTGEAEPCPDCDDGTEWVECKVCGGFGRVPKTVEEENAELDRYRGNAGPGGPPPIAAKQERRKTMTEHEWIGDCTCLDGESVNEMRDEPENITLEQFLEELDCEEYNLVDWARERKYSGVLSGWFPLAKDPHVAYYKSKYEGTPCLYLVWSCFENVWIEK